MSRWVSGSSLVDLTRAGYERIRAAHLNAVQAAVEDASRAWIGPENRSNAIGPSGCGASLQTHANGHYFTPAAIWPGSIATQSDCPAAHLVAVYLPGGTPISRLKALRKAISELYPRRLAIIGVVWPPARRRSARSPGRQPAAS
jgi:hypothetical protein